LLNGPLFSASLIPETIQT
jgi:H+/gluconate symporter-like permease